MTRPDLYIFVEIACQHDRGGSSVATIIEGVDCRQKWRLTNAEVRAGIRRLERAGKIDRNENSYFVSEQIVQMLPRTKCGQISLSRHAMATIATLLE